VAKRRKVGKSLNSRDYRKKGDTAKKTANEAPKGLDFQNEEIGLGQTGGDIVAVDTVINRYVCNWRKNVSWGLKEEGGKKKERGKKSGRREFMQVVKKIKSGNPQGGSHYRRKGRRSARI